MIEYTKGDIIKFDFNPTLGREQSYRPAIVISNKNFYRKTGLLIVLPISNTDNGFPLHIPLGEHVVTQGWVLCEHLKTIDAKARKVKYIETVSNGFIMKLDQYIRAIL